VDIDEVALSCLGTHLAQCLPDGRGSGLVVGERLDGEALSLQRRQEQADVVGAMDDRPRRRRHRLTGIGRHANQQRTLLRADGWQGAGHDAREQRQGPSEGDGEHGVARLFRQIAL